MVTDAKKAQKLARKLAELDATSDAIGWIVGGVSKQVTGQVEFDRISKATVKLAGVAARPGGSDAGSRSGCVPGVGVATPLGFLGAPVSFASTQSQP
jgi:hypothetical protein